MKVLGEPKICIYWREVAASLQVLEGVFFVWGVEFETQKACAMFLEAPVGDPAVEKSF